MNRENLENFMEFALEEARKAAVSGEIPVGAVILHQGKPVAWAGNQVLLQQNNAAHAEMVAMSRACTALGQHRLDDCDLVVTLEPCPMCAGAIAHMHIRRVYFGAYDPKTGGVDHGPRVFHHTHHRPEVYGGVLEHDCNTVLKQFFTNLRENV